MGLTHRIHCTHQPVLAVCDTLLLLLLLPPGGDGTTADKVAAGVASIGLSEPTVKRGMAEERTAEAPAGAAAH